MHNAIVYLIGYQGVGKLTIGGAICRLTGAVLVDNHLIANPVFTAVAIDRGGKLPDSVKQKVRGVRRIVLSAIAEDAPAAASFVLTDVLLDDEDSRGRYDDVVRLAEARSATLVPVVLSCSDDGEYARRVTDPARAGQLKQTDLAISLSRRAERQLLPIDSATRLDLEIGQLSPDAAAELILKHVQRVATAEFPVAGD